MDAQRRVLVFRKLLLPVSETFIRDQVCAYRTWTPTLLGYQRVSGLDLDDLNPVTVANGRSWIDWLQLKRHQHGQFLGHVPRSFQALVAEQRPDLIHAHFAYDAILVWDVARRLGLPLVVTLHGDDILRRAEVWRSGTQGHFFRLYPRKLRQMFADAAVHFVAVSHAVAERAIAQGAAPERVHVRYTGTRLDAPAEGEPSERRATVLFVGRLVAFKGCEFLVRAMALVQREMPEAGLVIIGDGPLRSELESLCGRLGVACSFLGAVDRTVVKRHMAGSRVFCLPSVTDEQDVFEAFGMVLLEAMGAGLPVVTSAKGGSEAIRHGETGFVVAERDVEAMAAFIVMLLRDDAMRERVARQARADVEARFAIEPCTARIETLYEAILDGQMQ